MMKKIAIGTGILLCVVVVALIVVTFFLGSIIKSAVNRVGPDVMGVDVSLRDVDFSLFQGRAELRGLFVGNPKGFDAASLCEVAELQVEMRPRSVLSDTIIIDKVHINRPIFTYQRGLKQSNLSTLLRQLGGGDESDEKKAEEPARDEDAKKIIIHELVIENAKVNASITAMHSKTISLSLPTIRLKDLGKDKGGAEIAEIVREVVSAVSSVISQLITESAHLAGKGAEAAGKALKEGVREGKELADKTIKSAGESVGKVLGGIKRLIPKEKK